MLSNTRSARLQMPNVKSIVSSSNFLKRIPATTRDGLRTCHVIAEPEPPGEAPQGAHEVGVVQDGEPDDQVHHTQGIEHHATWRSCSHVPGESSM